MFGLASGLCGLGKNWFAQSSHRLSEVFAWLALFKVGVDDFFDGIGNFVFGERAANNGSKRCGCAMAPKAPIRAA